MLSFAVVELRRLNQAPPAVSLAPLRSYFTGSIPACRLTVLFGFCIEWLIIFHRLFNVKTILLENVSC